MKTKEAIQHAACRLFNERGLAAVTLRDVASAMNRSYGNVTYHFANKELLVEALYWEMTGALAAVSKEFMGTQSPLEAILRAPRQTFQISMRYLFLYRDYLDIVRSYPSLASTIHRSNQSRMLGIRTVLVQLRDQALLRPELEDADLHYLMELSGAMRTFFFMQLRAEDHEKEGLEAEYLHYVNRLLYPYLSETGQAVYRRVSGGEA